jgi:diaminohydroxyphosphoribosylaminopyrimidine deaminase/5-amino-6-(5-phosphoribosylamino)uracil reductase
MSLDGKIATSSGESKWISNENSRRLARRMRSEVQAIMVGVGTVLADNPMLLSEAHGARDPRRIIVDSHARTPLEANVVSTTDKAETIIAVTGAAPAQRVKALCQRGCRVLEIEACEGRVDLKRLCAKLCEMGIITVLIEGGGQLLASAIEQRLVDEVRAFVAPLVIGGKEARTPVEGEGIKSIAESLRLKDVKTERIDGDTLIIGYVAEGAADVEQE